MANTERIRILEVGNSLGGLGGTEKSIELFVRHLNRDKYEPAIYANERFEGPRTQEVAALDAPLHHDCDLGEVLDAFRPHVVHVHRSGAEESYVIETAHAHGVPIILENNVFGHMDTSPSNDLIDCHIFISFFCLRRYQQWAKRPLVSDAYKVLYNPIDLAAFEAHSTPSERDYPVIGHISRPDDCKWSLMTIDMFPLLLEEVPNAIYHVIGETPQARAHFQALGVEDQVRYLPPINTEAELAAFYHGIDVLAHGSVMGESFGCTIAEAMAAGKPVVTHENHRGADNAQAELVEHMVTGFIVQSPTSYAEYVAYLLNHLDVARHWGRNGREKVRTCFDAPLVTRGLEQIIDYFHAHKVLGKCSR